MKKFLLLFVISMISPLCAEPKTIRIGLAQMKMTAHDEENFAQTLNMIEQAAVQGVDIITFPELQFNLFFPQYEKLDAKLHALAINSPKIKQLQDACKKHGIIAVPNFYLLENERYYDASIVIEADGTIIGISKMVHVPQGKFFYEQDYYQPSNSGFKVYSTSKGKIGIVVCFDRHLPESIRSVALQGADYVIIPTANLKNEPMDLFEWEMRVAAFHNNVFIAMCNRVGIENAMHFSGESLVCGPSGNTIKKGSDNQELIVVEIDNFELEKNRKSKPFLNFIRTDVHAHVHELSGCALRQ